MMNLTVWDHTEVLWMSPYCFLLKELTEYTHYIYIYIYSQRTKVEIQTPAHWNLIANGMTAPQPVIS